MRSESTHPKKANVNTMRTKLLVLAAAVLLAALVFWQAMFRHPASKASSGAATTAAPPAPSATPATGDAAPTVLYAHNLLLRKGPHFRVYVRWIRGEMVRTQPQANPTFDDQSSFVLDIQKGVIHVNIGDIADYLNTSLPSTSPLKKVSIQPAGGQLKIQGTLHKIVPLPVELLGTLSSTPQGLVKFHMNKIDVLKIPMKGLLGGLHLKLADLVEAKPIAGVQVVDNDIIFNTEQLLPPPHIRGQITSIMVRPPDIEVIYGNAPNDEAKLAQWHNFLRLSGGAIDFGKLTMHNVDLTMIDASKDSWFDLDLANYQAQVVHGYTRITAQAGLEIFMPDVDDKAPPKLSKDVSIEWLKDRNRSLPIDVPSQ
jgi:hypothetical protein